jgi:uncharacterized protein (TIGR03437 family)
MRRSLLALTIFSTLLTAAPADRITRPVDARRVRALAGGVHRLAQAAFDRGAVPGSARLDHIVLMTKMSPAQQSELDRLLADQQNPSSAGYHKWLTPEEYGARFGLSASDHSKVVAWLTAEGFQVKESARARNFVVFGGTAAQVERTLRTPLHRYEVEGEMHVANAATPSIPEALAEVVEGFIGLDDFRLQPDHKAIEPDFTSGGSHYLAPEDFATIYNLAPLYKAGLDGTGQSIAVVGQSAVLLSDIRAFRTRFNLPANDPRMVPYSTTDPGLLGGGAQEEGNLDLEWAGAIAPKATLYYGYGPSAFNAFLFAVSANVAPVISISYGGCEVDYRPSFYRSIGQQANAQGITVLASSGDAGATGCDRQGSAIATRGRMGHFPTVLPELTSVGGTQLVEGRGNYWGSANSANGGSAQSYIPEAAWNETSVAIGLLSGGGGASQLHAQPVWQTGPGVARGGMRQYPDVSFTAAVHDGYLIVYNGALLVAGGTSASTPAMAGLVALLNQHQVSKGFQSQPGLGNINPQLYRLAQAAPAAFHDTIEGDNIMPCAQGTPDCLTGTIGERAAAGYDMATGLGSLDADEFVKNWNLASKPVSVNLVVSSTRVTVNDVVYATAVVNGAGGSPTGRVEFSLGGVPLGSAELVTRPGQGQAADISFPVYQLGGTGSIVLTAQYSGDAAFNAGGATRSLTVTAPSGAAAITVSYPNTVWPSFPDAEGPGWQTRITLRDVGNVGSIVTLFRIDGEDQPLAKYFPSTAIPANGSVLVDVMFRKQATPMLRKFQFFGVDAGGRAWSREVEVNYLGATSSYGFWLTATPLTVNRTADPSCQWPVQVNVEALDGRENMLNGLWVGADFRTDLAAVFGTDRLAAWGSLQGTVCFNGITPPASGHIQVNGADGYISEVLVSFAGAPPAPAKLTPTPATVTLASPGKTEASIELSTPDKAQQWSVAVYPLSRMAGWLTVTPRSGTGSGKITLSASGAGYGPGAYRATVVIQSPTGSPQTVTVPVMFVLGAAGAEMTITAVGNPASGAPVGAPGGLLAIFGTGLARTTEISVPSAIPPTLAGVSAAVNGIAAPVLYVSTGQVNIQIPFEVGAGPAVVGLKNESGVAGAQFQIAPGAPGIFADADGALSPQKEIKAGAVSTLFLTGGGEVSLSMPTGFVTSPTSQVAAGPKPLLPLSLTIGGVPAFVQTAAVAPGQVGVLQVNFVAAAETPEGEQPVVVTVAGAASKPVMVVVTK